MNEDTQAPEHNVRRATLEDIPALKGLWLLNRLPEEELEKRFTEFQVVTDITGSLRGALGLHIHGKHGLIHSEVFADVAEAQMLRPLLWDRVVMVAKNHGLHRLWVLPTSSFYRQQPGMTEVNETVRKMLPEGFGSPMADWLTLKLREELPAALLAEKEFELFSAAQREANEKVVQQAQMLRVVAYLLLLLVMGGLVVLGMFAFKRAPRRNR